MGAEYIRFSNEEIFYGKKRMLESQLGLLTTIKRQRKYHELRRQELSLRIELKNKIDELKTHLDVLEKILPKTKMKEDLLEEKKIARNLIIPEKEVQQKQREFALERELEEIKARLSRLQ